MTVTETISYFFTLLALILAPGPMLFLLLTRAASNDVRGALSFALGAAIGNVLIVSAVCLGLSIWLSSAPEVLSYSKYLLLAYIFWIAQDIWKSQLVLHEQKQQRRSGMGLAFVMGFLTCILSPYTLILFPLLLPEVVDITVIEIPEYLILVLTTFASEATATAIIVGLACQLRRLTGSVRSMRVMNRILASVLVVGGTATAFV